MILTGLNRYRDFGLLLMRVGLAVMYIFHGWGKMAGGTKMWIGLATGVGLTAAPAFWGFMAAFAETVGAFLMGVGLFFRIGVLLLFLDMAGALSYHLRHGDPFVLFSRPIEMMSVFAGLFLIGAGRYSVDECCLRPENVKA